MSKPSLDRFDGPSAYPRRAAVLAVGAGFALLLGVLVHLTDRSGASAPMVPHVERLAGLHIFGAVDRWLPSFVHPFAFGLFTAVALPARAAPRYGACAFWGAVNLLFDTGQHAAIRAPLDEGQFLAAGPVWASQRDLLDTDKLRRHFACRRSLGRCVEQRRMARLPADTPL